MRLLWFSLGNKIPRKTLSTAEIIRKLVLLEVEGLNMFCWLQNQPEKLEGSTCLMQFQFWAITFQIFP